MNSVHGKTTLKILYHHRTQGRGAEGVHIASIVKALQSLGHDVKVLSPPGIDPLSTAGNAPVDKSTIKTSGISSVWKFISKQLPNFAFELIEIVYNIPALWRLYRVVSKDSYDLIYERYAFYMIAGAWVSRLFQIPLVLEANEVSGISDRARKQTFKRLCSMFERYLFKSCVSILTVSSHLKELAVRQGIESNRVKVVPNAIDPKKFHRDIDSMHLIQQYKLENRLVMGFAGWFDHWDRLDLLVEAFAELRKQYPQMLLLLVGDGAVLSTVRKMIVEYSLADSVILTGAVDREQVSNYLSLLDIAVITHSNEFGSPVVMFEFMGLKIPIVAPKLMPITDVLCDDETALLFEVLNMEHMKSRISELIEDQNKRASLAAKAHELLIKHHTWEDNARVIVDQVNLVIN